LLAFLFWINIEHNQNGPNQLSSPFTIFELNRSKTNPMKKFILLAACGFLFACGAEDIPPAPTPDMLTDTIPVLDSAAVVLDTMTVDTAMMDTATEGIVTTEEAEAMEAAEAEVTENKLDFCECVRKSKLLEDALIAEDDDAKFDLLFDEMTALEGLCPELKGAVNQTSVDAKKEHERRVKKCLKGM
jgi:hypothetical protein